MNRIKDKLSNYTPDDADALHKTIEELCSKGIGKGCFQDYGMLGDVIECMYELVNIVKEGENK